MFQRGADPGHGWISRKNRLPVSGATVTRFVPFARLMTLVVYTQFVPMRLVLCCSTNPPGDAGQDNTALLRLPAAMFKSGWAIDPVRI